MSTSQVLTQDDLISQLNQLAQQALAPWIKTNQFDFATAILFSMEVIEQFSSQTAALTGANKLKFAVLMLPNIVDMALAQGIITQATADTLKHDFTTGGILVNSIIESYVLVSKNPAVIQAEKEVVEAAQSCWARCTRARAAAVPSLK